MTSRVEHDPVRLQVGGEIVEATVWKTPINGVYFANAGGNGFGADSRDEAINRLRTFLEHREEVWHFEWWVERNSRW